jgi:hypothetical protein
VLHEIRNVRQERGGARRRWFESDGFDLVVWYDVGGGLTGFQICYDNGEDEHAVTWRPGWGFTHSVVDPGDENPLKNETPILRLPVGSPPWNDLVRRFDERSATLEPELRQLVHTKLAEKVGAGAG